MGISKAHSNIKLFTEELKLCSYMQTCVQEELQLCSYMQTCVQEELKLCSYMQTCVQEELQLCSYMYIIQTCVQQGTAAVYTCTCRLVFRMYAASVPPEHKSA